MLQWHIFSVECNTVSGMVWYGILATYSKCIGLDDPCLFLLLLQLQLQQPPSGHAAAGPFSAFSLAGGDIE